VKYALQRRTSIYAESQASALGSAPLAVGPRHGNHPGCRDQLDPWAVWGLFWLVPTILIYLLWSINNAWLFVVQVAEAQN